MEALINTAKRPAVQWIYFQTPLMFCIINVDWGQDLWRLKIWLDQNAKGRVVSLRPFGNPRLRQWPAEGWAPAPEGSAPSGLFALSKNYLYDVYPSVITDSNGHRRIEPSIRWLQKRRPVARIGYSIEVYDLGEAGK
jgi:hypothetical protein